MSLQNATSIDDVHFHQNAAIAAVAKLVGGNQAITVSTVTQAIAVNVYQTSATTAAAASVATLPAGAYPGQRKSIVLATIGTENDELTLTPGAGVTWKAAGGTDNVTSVTFDDEGEFLLVEWTGAQWNTLAASATVADDGG